MNKQQIVRLGDVATVVNDNEYDPINNNVTKYVAGGHIESEKLYVTKFGDVSKDIEIIGPAFHKLFKKGHILYKTRFPNSGSIATFDGLCSNTTLVLKTNKDSNLIEGLLPFIFHWDQFNEYITMQSVGSTNSYVRWRDLSNFEFVLPTKNDQFKLHEILWSIQNSIDNLENLLEKTKIHFLSKGESLMTRGIGHTKFKKVKSHFGKYKEIPEEWKLKKAKDVCTEISVGIVVQPAKLYSNIGVPCLRSFNIKEDHIFEKDIVLISDESNEANSKSKLKKGDVLIVRTGYPGTACVVPLKFEGGNCIDLVIARPKKELSSYFLSKFINSSFGKDQVLRTQAGLAQQHFNVGEMKNMLIPIPSFDEQQKIVSVLTKLNELISQQEFHLKNLYVLRKSILNSKLTPKEKTNVAN